MRPVVLGPMVAAALALGIVSLGSINTPIAETPAVAAQPGGPTLAQLVRALLTEDDLPFDWLWNDWYEVDADELDEPYPAVYADFVNDVNDDFLSVELHDARNGVPEILALRLLDEFAPEPDFFTEVEPTGFGTAGVRFYYEYDDDGTRWYGEVAAWRQDQVVVVILIESMDPEVCVCEYAAIQYEKLAATIP